MSYLLREKIRQKKGIALLVLVSVGVSESQSLLFEIG